MTEIPAKSIEEFLLLSAPIAWELAPKLCRRDPATGTTCAWHHGFWQLLRIMGMAGTAANRELLYRDTIQAACRETPSPRILISGTSDYAMLALALSATREIGGSAEITVVDLCETSLHLNHWYAAHQQSQINAICADILEFESPQRFDIICTDAFLGRLPPASWPALFNRWHSLLKSGGKIVTVSRLRLGASEKQEGFSTNEAGIFRDEVGRRARHLALPIPASQLEQAATAYAQMHFTYPVRSTEEIGSLLEQAGFIIDHLAEVQSTVDSQTGINAPSIPSGKKYLNVIAHRP